MKDTEENSFTEGQCSTGWGRWNAGVMKAMGETERKASLRFNAPIHCPFGISVVTCRFLVGGCWLLMCSRWWRDILTCLLTIVMLTRMRR